MTDWEAIEARLRVVCEIACNKRRCTTTSLVLLEMVEAMKAQERRVAELEKRLAAFDGFAPLMIGDKA